MQLGEFSEEVVRARAQEQYREGRARPRWSSVATALVDRRHARRVRQARVVAVLGAGRDPPGAAIRELLDAFHEADMPVIHLGYEVSLRGLNFPTTEWVVPIAEGFAGFEHDLFQKVSFYGPLQPDAGPGHPQALLQRLPRHGSTSSCAAWGCDLVIAGTMSNYCAAPRRARRSGTATV